MAKKRMTFEKHQREAKKKRIAQEKRALKRQKKEHKAQDGSAAGDLPPAVDTVSLS